jgi:hypothetical protein
MEHDWCLVDRFAKRAIVEQRGEPERRACVASFSKASRSHLRVGVAL